MLTKNWLHIKNNNTISTIQMRKKQYLKTFHTTNYWIINQFYTSILKMKGSKYIQNLCRHHTAKFIFTNAATWNTYKSQSWRSKHAPSRKNILAEHVSSFHCNRAQIICPVCLVGTAKNIQMRISGFESQSKPQLLIQ